jgi:flagellar biosynthetic protein FlhB
MSEEDQSSKTLEPTEKKLRKAREKGDVPSSRETGNLMSVFSLFVLTVFMLPIVTPDLAAQLQQILQNAGHFTVGTDSDGLRDIGTVTSSLFSGVAAAMAPVFLVMVIAAIFGVLIQGETVVALERIKPKLSKISPIKGLKKLFSADSLVEFIKNVAKVLVVGTLAVYFGYEAVAALWIAPSFVPETLPAYVLRAVTPVLVATTAFLSAIAIADIIWKRAQWIKKQRMSQKEVRDEHKESEGDPLLKAKRAEIRRQRARQRIAEAVPTATVILTNPTHYAVALRYEQGRDEAPVCVAKGMDLLAARIREIGRENEVPIVENRPLARALHATTEVDDSIPLEHWQAVAEIIGYVMDLRRNIRRKPPAGSSLREEP